MASFTRTLREYPWFRVSVLLLLAALAASVVGAIRYWAMQFSAVFIFQRPESSSLLEESGVYVAQFQQPGANLVYLRAAALPLTAVPTSYLWLQWGAGLWNRRTTAEGAIPATLLRRQHLGGELFTWVLSTLGYNRVQHHSQLLPAEAKPWPQLSSSPRGAHTWYSIPRVENQTLGMVSTVVGAAPSSVVSNTLVVDLANVAAASAAPPTAASTLHSIVTQPVTSFLFLTFGLVFFALFTSRLPTSAVVGSAQALLMRREYWRILSATLSHEAIMHLGMNGLSLYNLAFVEPQLGSFVYLLYTAELMVLVECVDAAARWFLAWRRDARAHWARKHLGFSGVLFAWMMVATAQLPEFCPLPMVPLCIPTFDIPLPFTISSGGLGARLPINLGPFLLLFLIQLLIPQSSFLGHASGIVAGLVVLWGGLAWVSPPLLASGLSLLATVHAVKVHSSISLSGELSDSAPPRTPREVTSGELDHIAEASSHATCFPTFAQSQAPTARFSSSGTLRGGSFGAGSVTSTIGLGGGGVRHEWRSLQLLSVAACMGLAALAAGAAALPALESLAILTWCIHCMLSILVEGSVYRLPTTPEPASSGATAEEVEGLLTTSPTQQTPNPSHTRWRFPGAQWASRASAQIPTLGPGLLLGLAVSSAIIVCQRFADAAALWIAQPALRSSACLAVSLGLPADRALSLAWAALALHLLAASFAFVSSSYRLHAVHSASPVSYILAAVSDPQSATSERRYSVSGGGGRHLSSSTA